MKIEDEIKLESRKWIKENEKKIIEKFIKNEPVFEGDPFTIFMAGSTGAGKTEYSKRFISSFKEINPDTYIARIDADEIKEIIPNYKGSQSYLFQSASSLGVEKMYDYVLKRKINSIVDGTLASYEVAYKNIARSINEKRITSIFYIYQDPIIAWEFTRKREKMEGRNISKEVFVESFFSARDNVDKLKNVFKNKIKIFLIDKNFKEKTEKLYFNIDNIDNYLKIKYNKKSLIKKIC